MLRECVIETSLTEIEIELFSLLDADKEPVSMCVYQ